MTVTSIVLIPSKDVETIQTTQFTASGVRVIVDKMTACNHTTNPVTIDLNIVTGGKATSNENKITFNRKLLAGETYTFPEVVGHVLQSGDFISTECSNGNSVSIRASGRQIT